MRQYGGENYLTTPIFDWEPYYRQELEQIRNDEWASNFYYDGIASGVVDIDEFGPQVPDSVQAKVAEKRDALVDGTVSVWEGTKFEAESDTFLFSQMSSYVPSVQGDVPGPQ
jgi:basic membrane protein A